MSEGKKETSTDKEKKEEPVVEKPTEKKPWWKFW
jgi:hypothetical protein